jgi:hypothetical protein
MGKATVVDEHAASVRPGIINADVDGTADCRHRYAFLCRTGTMLYRSIGTPHACAG